LKGYFPVLPQQILTDVNDEGTYQSDLPSLRSHLGVYGEQGSSSGTRSGERVAGELPVRDKYKAGEKLTVSYRPDASW
jgi:hypothetical protein